MYLPSCVCARGQSHLKFLGALSTTQAAANSPPHQQMVQLSLHTKAYLLARAAAVVPPVQGDSWAPRGQLEPERVCLFCGRPMAPD